MKLARIASAALCLALFSCRSESGSPVDVNVDSSQSALAPAYPLQRGPAGSRYLVDAQGVPFFWTGDTAWSLIAQVSLADAQEYLEDRKTKGVNVIMVNLIEANFSTNAPANFYGAAPFSGRPFATPNEAYFAHADAVIQAAAQRGITVLLAPIYLGAGCGVEGWCSLVQSATTAEMRSWGRYVGNRYSSYDNIVWLIGGDTNPSPVKSKVLEVVDGIHDFDTRHLMTAHNSAEDTAIAPWPGESWITVNNVYSYVDALYESFEAAYQVTPVMPFFQMESAYENERGVTAQGLRSQAYWSILSGAMGYIFGNCPIWHFGSSTWCGTTNWKGNLNTTGSIGMQYAKRLFTSRPWHTLVPDLSHVTLTAGYGTRGSATYATTARASDGATAIAYLPTSRQVTIDMSRISGSQANAWWYEPSAGLATSIGTFATSGARSFTPPASGDWVLVIDDASRGFPTPGSPPGSTNPDTVVNFESLANDAVLGSYGGITWGTTSGGWKVWDSGAYTKNAFVDSPSTSEVVATFALPTGRVLRSLKIASGSGGTATVKISSPGNPERSYTDIDGTYKTKTLAWTNAASVVTVKVTVPGQWGASDLAFDDVTYGEVAGSPSNQPPTVANAAVATPSTVTGTTTALAALGADDGGEGALTYAWTAPTLPSGGSVAFSTSGTNAAKAATATFTRAGTYGLRVTITDAGGLSTTSNVSVNVQPTFASVAVVPESITVATTSTTAFTATARDQFAIALASQPAFAWSVTGGGAVSSAGVFTAGAVAGGPFSLTASSGGKSGAAQITVSSAPPTDVTVNFEGLANDAVLGAYGGITWATAGGGWQVWDGGPAYTMNAYVNSTSPSEITSAFTLPAGRVLKSVKIASGSGGTATVKLSSPGNAERVYTDIDGSYKTKSLGWATAAQVVTVKITAPGVWGASDLAFDDIVYGAP